MNPIVKAVQRTVETASLCLVQSAELNRRLSDGQVDGRCYVREAFAIWRYNIRNFWRPEADPVHNASDLVRRR
ncbi:MAG TPA: hypothetical protein VL974_05790 [Magnetospirillum sp.]|jgi:hypothetical protein|nr:hypothetical protein [Magnetospirillum sp.]